MVSAKDATGCSRLVQTQPASLPHHPGPLGPVNPALQRHATPPCLLCLLHTLLSGFRPAEKGTAETGA